MLIKVADDQKIRLKLLGEFQNSDCLDDRQKDWLRRELRRFAPGIDGEHDVAYYLDRLFGPSKSHAVLHDLTLEADGQIAQIDHLVVDCALNFYLIEAKTYGGSLHINELGEFMVEYTGEPLSAIESPLEQSRGHAAVLKKVLERLGIGGRVGTEPTFVHVVMVHPKGIVHRSDPTAFDSRMVIKADQFSTWHKARSVKRRAGAAATGLVDVDPCNTVQDWGEQIKAEHCPANPLELPDFMKLLDRTQAFFRKNVFSHPALGAAVQSTFSVCEVCGKKLSPKVAKYCIDRSPRFGGRCYCYEHQAEAKRA